MKKREILFCSECDSTRLVKKEIVCGVKDGADGAACALLTRGSYHKTIRNNLTTPVKLGSTVLYALIYK